MERQNLPDFFQEHKAILMDIWFEAILNHYPPETARIFKREKDPFANPIGYNLKVGVEEILDRFIKEDKEKNVSDSLDKIIRIWAIQDFTPSQTVSFLIIFKQIVKKQMKKHYQNQEQLWINWQVFEQEVDNLILMAMDIYTKCREKLYQIRIEEANKRVYSLLRRANMMVTTEAEAKNSEAIMDSWDLCKSCNPCETEKKGCKNEFTF